jgi:hypothetical protein
MPTRHEAIVLGLIATLAAQPVPVWRQQVLPRHCPVTGIVNLVPQDPVETGHRLGVGVREWQRAIELEIIVQGQTATERSGALDVVVAPIGQILTGNTLGGLVDYIDLGPPQEADDVPMEGAESLSGAVVTVTLFYETSTNPMEIQT